MNPIPLADLRAELLDNPEIDLQGPADFLQAFTSDAGLPAGCVIAIKAAINSLKAARDHLESAAAIAERLAP